MSVHFSFGSFDSDWGCYGEPCSFLLDFSFFRLFTLPMFSGSEINELRFSHGFCWQWILYVNNWLNNFVTAVKDG